MFTNDHPDPILPGNLTARIPSPSPPEVGTYDSAEDLSDAMAARCVAIIAEDEGGVAVGAVVVVCSGHYDGGGAADGDGGAEYITRRAVVGQELEELAAEVFAGRGSAQD